MRRLSTLLAIVGVVTVVAGVLLVPTVQARYDKLASGLSADLRYTGVGTGFGDDGLRFLVPEADDVVLTRRIRADDGATTSDVAVLTEAVTMTVGERTIERANEYAIDRTTHRTVDGHGAYTFTKDNILRRGGAYALVLPDDINATSELEIWNASTARPATFTPTADADGEVAGIQTLRFEASYPSTPVTFHQLAVLYELGFDNQLSGSTIRQVLALQGGVDVDTILTELLPRLTSLEATAVRQRFDEPVRVMYQQSGRTDIAVDPDSGRVVSTSFVERTTAKADIRFLSGEKSRASELVALRAVLEMNRDVPGVPTLIDTLDAWNAEAPVRVFQLSVSEDPASVEATADDIRSRRHEERFATRYIPGAVIGGGLLLLVLAVVLARQRPTGRAGRASIGGPARRRPQVA